MPELVSILVPAFNAQKWIGAALESAVAQTWPAKEILVVDDGSTDRTAAVAAGFGAAGVRVVRQDHAGSATARNRALALAAGDYIQWLDADDVLAPDKIARQMALARTDPEGLTLFSSAWGQFYSRPERHRPQPSSLWTDLSPAEWITRKLLEGAWMTIESWLVSRRLAGRAGPWDEDLVLDTDGEYFCRVVAQSQKVVFVPDAFSYCRTGNFGSISSTANLSERKLASLLRSAELQIGQLRGLEDSPRARAAGLECLRRMTIFLFPDEPALYGRAQDLASGLGGSLQPPDLGRKYGWIRRLFGWRAALRTRRFLRRSRTRLDKALDALGFRLS